MSEPSLPNRGQAETWNAGKGRAWVELQAELDRLFAPIADRVVEDGFPGEGGQVLDIGCGGGATTLAMARRLGPDGRCVGVDISGPLVEAAVAGARAAELPSAGFITADAQTWPFQPASFDAAISRFGVMFFEDPTAAFRNIRRAVRPSGKLAFAAWRSPAENPFMTAAAPAAAALLPELQAASDPDAPGQFAFAREDRTRRILADAGWTGIELAPLDVPAAMPERDLPDFVARVGPLGTALQALDAPERPRVIEAVLPAFDRFVRDGVVAFDMACWMVTAKA